MLIPATIGICIWRWQVAATGTVSVSRSQPRTVDLAYVSHLWDRYNWNGKKSTTIPTPIGTQVITDKQVAELHRRGVAGSTMFWANLKSTVEGAFVPEVAVTWRPLRARPQVPRGQAARRGRCRPEAPALWYGRFIALVVGIVLIMLIGCTESDSAGTRSRSTAPNGVPPTARAELASVGFRDMTGLELLYEHDEGALDSIVEFVFRGSPSEVDAALKKAKFDADFEPGLQLNMPPLKEFERSSLSKLRSADDKWTSKDGQIYYRQVIRGVGRNGEETVNVAAFTT